MSGLPASQLAALAVAGLFAATEKRILELTKEVERLEAGAKPEGGLAGA